MSVDLDSADQDSREAMDRHRRQIPEEQLRKLEGFMSEILTAFGMEPNTPATVATPRPSSGPSSISPPATTAIRNCSRCLPPNVTGDPIAG